MESYEDNRYLYIVMEYVEEATDLEHVIKNLSMEQDKPEQHNVTTRHCLDPITTIMSTSGGKDGEKVITKVLPPQKPLGASTKTVAGYKTAVGKINNYLIEQNPFNDASINKLDAITSEHVEGEHYGYLIQGYYNWLARTAFEVRG